MITVKLSHSILSQWAQGNFEEAVGGYLGKRLPATPAMELGRIKHELWANYTMKHKALHPDLGGDKLQSPIVEQKYQKLIPFSDKYQILLRGIIDLEDGDMIVDHKCTASTPSKYVEDMQLDYYRLLRPHATLGKYICHNPYKSEATGEPSYSIGIKFLSDKNAERALEHIITFGGELIQYLEYNKLIEDYKL